MLLFNYSPDPASFDPDRYYARVAQEGMVHSALMKGEHFDMAAHFDESWAVASVSWSCGGKETYRLGGKRALALGPAGVITIAAEERYAYDASDEAPFRSSMIAFPQWMTKAAACDDEFAEKNRERALQTRLCRPSEETFAVMNGAAKRCAAGDDDAAWYEEQAALIYHRLLSEQQRNPGGVEAARASTRNELSRRIETAVQFMLEEYSDPALSISEIARAACVSRFHFIRVFKDVKGATPIQFLARVRMDAALRLLCEQRRSVEETAAAVGYQNRTAFVRAFSRHYGATPSAMKSRLQ